MKSRHRMMHCMCVQFSPNVRILLHFWIGHLVLSNKATGGTVNVDHTSLETMIFKYVKLWLVSSTPDVVSSGQCSPSTRPNKATKH